MTNSHLFIRMWEFSIIAPVIVSGFLICFYRMDLEQTASQIECFKANSEKVLLEPVRESAVLNSPYYGSPSRLWSGRDLRLACCEAS